MTQDSPPTQVPATDLLAGTEPPCDVATRDLVCQKTTGKRRRKSAVTEPALPSVYEERGILLL